MPARRSARRDQDDRARRRLGPPAARPGAVGGRGATRLRRHLRHARKLSRDRRRPRRSDVAGRGAPGRNARRTFRHARTRRSRGTGRRSWSGGAATSSPTGSTPAAARSRSGPRPTGRCSGTRSTAHRRPDPPRRDRRRRPDRALRARDLDALLRDDCGPFLRRLIKATAAQDIWNAFLASHTTGRCARSASSLVCHNPASPCNDRLPEAPPRGPTGRTTAPPPHRSSPAP